ncbi:MAG: stress response translation initiation inhibitor YciH [Crenarchaeota archaeon]|nr:stress response translation initiation inhibitor YciH [Thermoproteota archaeon]MCR8453564.1 stress response translation initiation inhibitor YciH [Thermoproteota archaeon]MCR8454793.1 stress response translation initiation inhibitor YciH [Thermoproteota archaeon]MCR8462685.1 stress response translation initiation inhibitor YciH [Thermoproteota archaeon]MCR8470304.1 stress response translation initiation inhibitor YciH [Thermoproteota archaeon]
MASKLPPKKPLDFKQRLALVTKKVRVFTETRKKTHVVTIIQGLDSKSTNLEDITSKLKKHCATGGTYKNDSRYGEIILLQGDQVNKVKQFLTKELGIPEENIETV